MVEVGLDFSTYIAERTRDFTGREWVFAEIDRWLTERPLGEPAIWVENLPYFETRDYIPRVLAFTTLYDWRLQRPVSRISSRMPAFDSGAAGVNMQRGETVEVVCRTPG